MRCAVWNEWAESIAVAAARKRMAPANSDRDTATQIRQRRRFIPYATLPLAFPVVMVADVVDYVVMCSS